jgi:SAM-dependent methyltransferase
MAIFGVEKWEAPDRKFFGHRDCLVRNMSRYNFIAERAARGRCLDLGCGRGYGFDYLKPKCASCTGLDVSEAFLREARALYPEITFVRQSSKKLPFDDASFNTIACFEVIEHMEDHVGFLREIVRIAARGAVVAISTPNRLIASGDLKTPLNKFHVREYVAEEFRVLLEPHFAEVILYGQSDGGGGDGSSAGFAASWMNRIPVRIKYLMPFYVQNMVSVLLRPALKMDDCRFDLNTFEQAHTLYAICRVSG